MVCPNCGYQIPDGAKFCTKCGTPVFIQNGEKHPRKKVPNLNFSRFRNKTPKEGGPKKKKFLKITLLVGVVLLAAILLFFYYYDQIMYAPSVDCPAHYFDTVAEVQEFEEEDAWGVILNAEGNISVALERYANGQKRQGFRVATMDDQEGYFLFYGKKLPFISDDPDNADVVIYFMGYDEESNISEAVIVLNHPEKIGRTAYFQFEGELPSGGSSSDPLEIESEPSSQMLTTPTLPDPTAFLGGLDAPVEDAEYAGRYRYYRMSIDAGWDACHEFVELLQEPRFGLTLRDQWSETILYLVSESYIFDYTEGEIEPAGHRYYDTNIRNFVDYEADVFITIQKNSDGLYSAMSIVYSDDFDVEDLGDRASNASSIGPGSSGGGSSDTSYSSSYPTVEPLPETRCQSCDGSGDCIGCYGDGLFNNSYLGGGDTGPCKLCNSSGNCRVCGGDGYQ